MEVWPSLELLDAQNLRLETEVDREGRHVKGGCAQDPEIPLKQHALVHLSVGGKRKIHSLPYADPNLLACRVMVIQHLHCTLQVWSASLKVSMGVYALVHVFFFCCVFFDTYVASFFCLC